MDLEITSDKVDREGFCKLLNMWGVDGKLLRVVKSMYEEAKAAVWVGGGFKWVLYFDNWDQTRMHCLHGCCVNKDGGHEGNTG